jgi:hypothetical protein
VGGSRVCIGVLKWVFLFGFFEVGGIFLSVQRDAKDGRSETCK